MWDILISQLFTSLVRFILPVMFMWRILNTAAMTMTEYEGRCAGLQLSSWRHSFKLHYLLHIQISMNTILFIIILCLEFASNLRNQTHKTMEPSSSFLIEERPIISLRPGSCFSLSCYVKSLWKPCKKFLQFIWPQSEATEQIFHL